MKPSSGLATRALSLAERVVSLAAQARSRKLPAALVLAIRATTRLVEAAGRGKLNVPTPVQRQALLAAAAKLRAVASSVLASQEGADPQSVEFALAELIARTLALIERASAEPTVIGATAEEAADRLPR